MPSSRCLPAGATPAGIASPAAPQDGWVSYGSDVLARHLDFGAATSYAAVSPGEQTVQFTSSGEHATMPVSLGADTIHTIFVLDDSSGLEVDP